MSFTAQDNKKGCEVKQSLYESRSNFVRKGLSHDIKSFKFPLEDFLHR